MQFIFLFLINTMLYEKNNESRILLLTKSNQLFGIFPIFSIIMDDLSP
ncbi:hypothetical protein BC670_1420 [Flavobacterium branchiophilum]|uniref:Uncharacterized protein n=1 Tax=Flavobacterium branchiophilum TaxID=55197 RepID=A0A543G375_9FLAO|nr:hypothetical protein BC670_1420 [Flavobacterium branchiophilum]